MSHEIVTIYVAAFRVIARMLVSFRYRSNNTYLFAKYVGVYVRVQC